MKNTDSIGARLKRWMWWLLRGVFFAVVLVVTLLGLAWVFENWRAERHWNQVQRSLTERSVVLDASTLIPPEVPDEDNFGALPFWTAHFVAPGYGSKQRKEMELPPLSKTEMAARENGASTGRIPLATYVEAFALSTNWTGFKPTGNDAADVVGALDRMEPTFRMLRDGLQRRHRQFPIQYEDGYRAFLWHLATLVTIQRTLDVRAHALLENGEPGRAYETVRLSLGLSSALGTETFLISQAVRRRQCRLSMHGIWMGLNRHVWTEEVLKEFQESIEGWDLVAAAAQSLRFERVQAHQAFESGLGDSKEFFRRYSELNGASIDLPVIPIPRFLIRENQARYHVAMEALVEKMIEGSLEYPVPKGRGHFQLFGILPDTRLTPCDVAAARLVPQSVYNVFARAFVPTPEPLIESLLSTMTMARMATVACALERCRIADGVYPSDLKALSPRWLKQMPLDPLDHKVFRYERDSDGGFKLQGSRPDWIWEEEWLIAEERL